MPVIVILVPSTRAVPVARAVHPDDIMLLFGMSIVKVMSSPDIVPENAPGHPARHAGEAHGAGDR